MRLFQLILSIIYSALALSSFASDYYYATNKLNVRSGAGAQYPVITVLEKGEKVELISKKGNWYKIKISSTSGYAHSQYLDRKSMYERDSRIRFLFIILIALIIVVGIIKRVKFYTNRIKRRDYYRNVYLNSEEWQRKRYVVLKRDGWKCVYCGDKATEIHHKRYARKNIGNEPIEWLVAICRSCHDMKHS
jgi:uncharacterized protein YgiM (DUF1202 family)